MPPPVPAGPRMPTERVCTLYVGKIPAEIDDSVINELLQACGKVVKWKRTVDPETSKPKSFGFCDFMTGEGVAAQSRCQDTGFSE